jgi:hypothetical protein
MEMGLGAKLNKLEIFRKLGLAFFEKKKQNQHVLKVMVLQLK